MGHRLSKIYTRKGDDGTTGLGDGSRTSKDSPRVDAMGDIDELNSCIGVMLTHDVPEEIQSCLSSVQHTLFDIGGELSIPGLVLVKDDRVTFLEQNLDQFNSELAPLKEFILPGGTPAAAMGHIARSVCRRAERKFHTLAKSEDVSEVSRKYLNRLSDLLFVISRYINLEAGGKDICGNTTELKNRSKSI